MPTLSGHLRKMRVTLAEDGERATYRLVLDGDAVLDLDPLIGQTLQLRHNGQIRCVNCGRATKKSFNSGYCFPCLGRLAECDRCIVAPHTCHFDDGTCRDEAWAQSHCFQPHIVYLARSSGLKVGLTRGTQRPTRWLDQGAVEAVEIAETQDRRAAGLMEHALAQEMSDRTDWRKMLKGLISEEPFEPVIEGLRNLLDPSMHDALLETPRWHKFSYPVEQHPEKVTSKGLTKNPEQEGVLTGIKGQYLIFGTSVINLRNHAGYHVEFSY